MTAAGIADVYRPRTIGPYEVLYEIGRGAMGVVYSAVRDRGGPPVALKVPSEGMADQFGCMRREIHALGRLSHPGVVRIIEEGVERGVPWYAMELLDARSLDELLGISHASIDATEPVRPFEPAAGMPAIRSMAHARTPIRGDLHRALTLMYRLARVLAYVHAHGIVHRDLKPHNILVRAGDRPVLVDFGLMGNFRAQSGRETLEIGGVMMGTALYTAPEQAGGELVDARADLYSFGAMLYEIVTGVPPFDGSSVREVLMMHLSTLPVPPTQLVDGVPPVLETLILNLLEKRRAERLGYAEDVAALLVEAGAEPDPDWEIETAAYLYRPEIIGREEILGSLRARLPKARQGNGAFACLGGESGIGKTSVASAFARDAMLRGFRVVVGETDPIGGQPFHPLRPLLREIADLCRADPEVFEQVVSPRLAVLRELDPALAALSDDGALRIPPEIVSRRIFDDLAATIAALARRRPLLLVLDDLQWADEVTLRFLSSLDASFFAGLPLLVVATYRADEAGPDLRALLAKPAVVSMPLGRLDETSVGDIARSMLAAPDAPPSFLHFLARQSEGNPFFVAEYLRAAVAAQLLVREKGRWIVHAEDQTYATLGLPGTIRALVGHRLDRLSAVAQGIAEAAAVLGREVPESLLLAIGAEGEDEAIEGISELLERHVFDLVRDGDGVRFVHDKLREGAYDRLTPERRRLLHGRAAGRIEALCTNDELLKQHAAEIAHHCEMAGLDDEAIRFYAMAAESALSTGACRESVDLTGRALDLDRRRLANEPAGDRALRHAHWHRLLSHAHYGLGDLAASAEEARRSLSQVGIDLPRTAGGWRVRLLLEAMRQAIHLVLPRRWLRARDARQPVLREIALSAMKFSETSYFATELERMLVAGLLCLNAAERLDDSSGAARAYANLGAVASVAGLRRLANRYFDEGHRLATETNDVESLAHVGYTSVFHYVAFCNWYKCALYAEDTVDVARMAGDDQAIESCLAARASVEYYEGRLEASLATHTAIRDGAHKRANRQHEAWGHSGRARALILLGRLEEALEAIQLGLELANDWMVTVALNGSKAIALLHLGRLDEALHAADATFELALKTKITLWQSFRGFSAPAEVYVELWPRLCHNPPEDVCLRRRMDLVLRGLRSYARRTPLVRPVVLRFAGILECLEGNPGRGEKLLRNSTAEAVRLGLRLDEGIAEYELMRHGRLDAREQTLRSKRARAIFRSLGCVLYLRKLDELQQRPSW